ncbi:MurR/RpiR family transcriptional regulator [Paenibacillus thermoaerophilus]|uniref:MurR/RpiR family transcriptional regulator n=1 Tax=Paenibacillus thermoaerophilus TaxID=1215385 RepID=A0ABW2V508_9BACL|nr:MurR/RpiR family transcriptional regulator [Paenibacillus thermoaerophilus]TMV17955.1 MurR/RpiR family transcriptional regulator [Paenibacillus thermoaerophilus]
MSLNENKEPANALLLLSSHYNSLTKTERKVADTVLTEPEASLYMTLTALAEKAGTGETTILRLCRKLGFEGYQDFKLSLAQHLAQTNAQAQEQIGHRDDLPALIRKIAAKDAAMIDNTSAMLSAEQVQKAVDAILNARTVYLFGVGSSGNTAKDAFYQFMRMGLSTLAVTDSHLMAMSAALAGPEDVIVGISTSGSTKDLVDAVRIAKQNGSYVIALTSHARSPLTRHADSVLLAQSRETPLQGGAFSSKIAQIYTLDVLSTAAAMRRGEKSDEARRLTAQAVSDKLY